MFSTYAADTPQIYLDIDRDKAQVLGVKISDIFNALQSTLGSLLHQRLQRFRPHLAGQYPGRDAVSPAHRRHRPHLCAQRQGRHGADRARWPRRKLVQGPQTVVRYNGYRAAIVNGAPKPGYSSGQALAAMERISATTLPAGYSFEWTGTALQEKAASGQTGDRARPRRSVRLSVSGRALRELEHSDSGLLSVSVAVLGALVARGARRAELRRLRADRTRRADRAGRQERHSDRRVRGRAAAARQGRRRQPPSRPPRCAFAR